jgi:hypothetical protein
MLIVNKVFNFMNIKTFIRAPRRRGRVYQRALSKGLIKGALSKGLIKGALSKGLIKGPYQRGLIKGVLSKG